MRLGVLVSVYFNGVVDGETRSPIVCNVSSRVWPTLSDKVRLGIPFAPRRSFEHAASPAAALNRCAIRDTIDPEFTVGCSL